LEELGVCTVEDEQITREQFYYEGARLPGDAGEGGPRRQ
jgi:hypothetical protein